MLSYVSNLTLYGGLLSFCPMAMAAAAADDIIGYDMMEQILVRSDVEDLIRCKGVSKSWYSMISTPCFEESYLKRTYPNDDPKLTKRITGIGSDSGFLVENMLFVVGSANGLVCVSPQGFQLVVVNPCTRQTLKILEPPPEPLPESDQRWDLLWGFGYDSSNNDYKIVVGLVVPAEDPTRPRTRFYVLSLKTCRWKFIGEYDYASTNYQSSVCGILCDGALHWDMMNSQTDELAVFSFNLSREEFTMIQLPDGHSQYDVFRNHFTLGVMEGSLHLYATSPSTETWVLRSDDTSSGKQYWELLPHNYVINYDAVYFMDDDYSLDDTPRVVLCNTLRYSGAIIYVRSLVSPYVNMDSSSKSVVISMEEKAGDKEE